MKVLFLVPAHERVRLAIVCLRQLERTCAELRKEGIQASALVLGSDERILDVARGLGFGVVVCTNDPLGRKWNHGYQLATDPEWNSSPADYVIPFGSDDWVDPQLLLTAPWPKPHEMTYFTRGAVVDESGKRMSRLRIRYAGGWGIRIIPRALVAACDYRPASEFSQRALDASTLRGIIAANGTARWVRHDLHADQLVDWKTRHLQLNDYRACLAYRIGDEVDPWVELAQVYPADALAEMRQVYGHALERV